MKIIVCMKQVPSTNKVKLNKDTYTINREGQGSIINPLDRHALEEAIRIKERVGGKITALSMGIPSTQKLLKQSTALGVDEAVLLSDKVFAGADTLATSYILSLGIKKITDYDLIICGNQALDGDTGQVGPSLAEKLGIPHVTCIVEILEIVNDYMICKKETDKGYEIIKLILPALITISKEINEPRFPTIKGMMMARKSSVEIWDAKKIKANKDMCGLRGSPTRVIETFIPNYSFESEIIKGLPKEQAKCLVEKLVDII